MNKESIYELQKIDCCCNDCGYMVRDLEKYRLVLEDDKKWQLIFFRSKKARAIIRARQHKNPEKRQLALSDAIALKHTYFPQRIPIGYGACTKFGKQIDFIPNTCQLDTQNCFVHRKDLYNNNQTK